ncbi:MAG: hypothetical protein Q9Q40_03210 [Acidobacteriota bacterium]|nr:hypothetical protein [Acidobacteriota bacterium]MDQ7086768.1 hypothetical protein [Acidobacteriota bacterium]
MTPRLTPLARRVVEIVAARGGRAIVVGGAVRDALLGLDSKDLDLEIYGMEAAALEQELLAAGIKVNAVGRSFGVFKVGDADEGTVDLSLPRRDSRRGRGHRGFVVTPDPRMSFAEAASRRDFTINAMGYDPLRGVWLDPWGGREDLRAGRLRHVGPAFVEDPLRVLRGFQLAARFDLEVDPATVELCRSMRDEAGTLAAERIWVEWAKWAERSERPSRGLEFLRLCGWIQLYPELEALVDCPQDPQWHPEGDVWVHTLLTCDAAVAVARREALRAEERLVLVLAALVHDLGKPETTTIDGTRVRSRGHGEAVATFETFLGRIDAPRRLRRRVIILCRRHLDHLGFQGSRRAVRRLSRALAEEGESIEALVRLIEADHSARPPLPGGCPPSAREMLEVARAIEVTRAAPRPLLMGRHLVALGLEPGPEIGRWVEAAYQAQMDEAFDDLDGALAWIRRRIESGAGPEGGGG